MKTQKNALASVTIWGLLVSVVPIVSAVMATGWTAENLTLISGWIVAAIGRLRQGDLTILPKSTPPAALFLAIGLGVTTMNCAAPASEQGRASQGGSTGQQPVVNLSFAFGGDIHVTGTSSATAAPSAASEAQARQDAKQDTSVPIDASGVIPTAGAGKVLGAIKAPAAPVVIPAEIVVPAPVPAPAPTVPAVDAPVPPPPAPIGGTSALRGLETNNG